MHLSTSAIDKTRALCEFKWCMKNLMCVFLLFLFLSHCIMRSRMSYELKVKCIAINRMCRYPRVVCVSIDTMHTRARPNTHIRYVLVLSKHKRENSICSSNEFSLLLYRYPIKYLQMRCRCPICCRTQSCIALINMFRSSSLHTGCFSGVCY